jgi:hypothetical protein
MTAPVFDAIGASITDAGNWVHTGTDTVTAGSTALLWVIYANQTGARDITARFANEPMILVGEPVVFAAEWSFYYMAVAFKLPDAPGGPQNYIITTTGETGSYVKANVSSYDGVVDVSELIVDYGSGVLMELGNVPSAKNHLVAQCFGWIGGGVHNADYNGTLRWSNVGATAWPQAGMLLGDKAGEPWVTFSTTKGDVDAWVGMAIDLGAPVLPPLPPSPSGPASLVPVSGDEDRFRFIVEEARTGNILSVDLEVQNPKVMRVLSGSCHIEFDVDYRAYESQGLYFKPWGHWIHAEKKVLGERVIWASALVQPSDIDKATGVMHLVAEGFASYPKQMPLLENWNYLAIDPFEFVGKIWDHLQSYDNGNLGVTVSPRDSGLEILPGYSFDGSSTNFNFFAEFIRAADRNDCGDLIDALARDIPFDYIEQSTWNPSRTAISKQITLGYPIVGAQQNGLAFILNENVLESSPHTETQIDWVSDVLVDGWWPGQEVSSELSNADPKRYRRVINENDAMINSNERAAAWANRKLTRRQTPAFWDSIIVDMGHPNAPFGTYDVGDRIFVTGYMPWVGDVHQLHKIIAIAVDEEHEACEITMYAEGAYTYEPIGYSGDEVLSITMAVTDPGEIAVETNIILGAHYLTTPSILVEPTGSVTIQNFVRAGTVNVLCPPITGGLSP